MIQAGSAVSSIGYGDDDDITIIDPVVSLFENLSGRQYKRDCTWTPSHGLR